MSKFSKFLTNNEEPLLVIKKSNRSRQFYLIIFIVLPLAFFLLYPMGSQGRQGFFLWLTLIIILLIIAIKQLVKQRDCYLLTNQKIIHLTLQAKDNYSRHGSIALKDITKIKKIGRQSICLWQKDRRFYLNNIEDRDKFWRKIILIKTQ